MSTAATFFAVLNNVAAVVGNTEWPAASSVIF